MVGRLLFEIREFVGGVRRIGTPTRYRERDRPRESLRLGPYLGVWEPAGTVISTQSTLGLSPFTHARTRTQRVPEDHDTGLVKFFSLYYPHPRT